MFGHFDTMHACDRQTDGHTDGRTELAYIRAIAYMLSRVKINDYYVLLATRYKKFSCSRGLIV